MSPQTTACATTTGNPAMSFSISTIAPLQLLEVVERLIHRADDGAGNAAFIVEPAEQHQVVEIRRGLQLPVQIEVRILPLEQFLQLADRRPFNRLAGDRAPEDEVGLVFGVDGQLEVEAVVDVDVREDAGLAVLDNLLALDVELIA